MIKILNITFSKGLGGIEQSFIDYTNMFDSLGYKTVTIVSKNAVLKNSIPKHIKTHELFNLGEFDIFAQYRLKRLIMQISPDVIMVHARRAAKLIKRCAAGIPIIGITHNYKVDYLLDLDYVIAITKHLQNQLISFGYDTNKIIYLPNTISITKEPLPYKPHSVAVIGAMGRFVTKKGFHIFLKALSLLRKKNLEFKAIIAGDGHEKNSLNQLCQKLGLEDVVEFIGWAKDKDRFFNNIDIFCLPSTHEPFGIVMLEAFMYSKPVVSFASEGPSEIGTDEHDTLFAKLGDAQDLSNKIGELISNKTLPTKLASNAYSTVVNKFDSKNIARELNALIQKITRTHK